MAYEDRVVIYREIEKIRNRPLITYVTSNRPNASGIMASDAIPQFCKQISDIPEDEKNIDLLVVSDGGDPNVSWRIISLLRERFEKIGILLPFQAYSAATLLALGADEIIMHPYSNLGPVDPQLIGTPNGQNPPGNIQENKFSTEDIAYYLEFVKNDVGIKTEEQKEKAFELICSAVGPVKIGMAKRSSNLALSIAEKLLSLHMTEKKKIKQITNAFNKSFYHHGYPIGRSEAKSIGLNVNTREKEIESLIWNLWLDLESEMKCQNPFNPFDVVLNDPKLSQQIRPVPQIQVPINIPPQLLQGVMQQIHQNMSIASIQPIEHEVIQAIIESSRIKSNFRTKFLISAVRMPDLNININVTPMTQGWK
ncbi:Serine dehydrogenase proteinase [anaerobic digester metagenome]